MWYNNPAWWAFIISTFALLISILTLSHRKKSYEHTRTKTKSEIQRELINKQIKINESFMNYEVKGPYAHHLNIPDDRVKDFTAKGLILLNHLNLLQDVYNNRLILGNEITKDYEEWAKTIVRPWIESDDELKKIWKIARESRDLFGKDFTNWVNGLWPIIDPT